MSFKKNYPILILTLFVSSALLAQKAQLNFKHLSSDEGLTQGVIHDVFTDSKGFVWMTSPDGITRFDGTRCLANNAIAPGLSGITYTQGIVEDKLGDIWIGYTEGLIRFNYHLNHFECIKLSLPRTNILSDRLKVFIPFVADVAGNIAVYISNNTCLLFAPHEKKLTLLPMPPGRALNLSLTFLKDRKRSVYNNLYCASLLREKLTLFRFDGFKKGKPVWDSVASTMWMEGNLGNVVMQNDSTAITCSRGLIGKYHFNTGQFELKSFPVVNSPFVTVDPQQNIWVGTYSDGLYAVNGESLEVTEQYRHESGNTYGISSNWVVPVCDSLGNLWLSSWGKGVDYCNISDIKFTSTFSEKQTQPYHTSSFIRDIVKDDQGNFYCSSQMGGVVQLDQKLQYTRHLPDVPPSLTSPDMFLKGQYLYFGVDAYEDEAWFYRYDLTTGKSKKIQNGAKEDLRMTKVYQLAPMTNGHLLTATYAGLWEFNTETDAFESLPGITETFETVVFSHQDMHGHVYKGVNANGFEIYQPTAGRYEKIFTLAKKITIKHCVEINDSLMWIGSTDGLYFFDTRNLAIKKHFSTTNGLPNNVVYAIMPDEKGNLWLSTNKGLSYFCVATELFKNFTVEDGLQSNEFNTHTVVKANDGRIIFGGVNGLTTINAAMLEKKSPAPIIQITGIKADSAMNPFAFNDQDKLVLSAGSSTIEFQLTVIDFINPSKCKIAYRLSGYINEWTEVANPAIARFIKLPAGHYILEYRASNADGKWAKEIKSFSFDIAAYWWQTALFKTGIFTIGAAMLFILFRLYIHSRLRQQKMILEKAHAVQLERERIITDLHDDVGATLSSMHIYGDLAKNVWDSRPEASKEMVGKITQQAKDLMIRMGDIIWSMKPADEEKYSFTARLKNYSNELLAAKNIECNFNIDESLSRQIINPYARKNILLIAKEAMNNIAKYSEATKADVLLIHEDGNVLLSISDNGKGYDAGENVSGNGTGNIIQRCKQLQGSCNIQAFPGQGVKIKCSFPIAIISHNRK